MESCPLIQKLRSVQVQVTERREDETAFWDLYDVRQVLSIVGYKFCDESAAIDL